MKKITSLIALLIFTYSYSQTNSTSFLNLEYVVIQNGKEKKAIFHKLKQKSIYYYVNEDTLKIKERKENREGETNYHVELKSGDKIFGNVETNLESKKMFSSERVFKSNDYKKFTVLEYIPSIKWNLLPENKLISKYNCKKATTTYKGRDYIVWYTLEVPLFFGPWKLHGLPGMIVKAYDTENYINFQLTKINFKNQDITYSPIEKQDYILCKDLFKLKNNQANEMKKKIQSKLPRGAVFSLKNVENKWLEKDCK
jgi:GLPGLI family protein